MKRISRKQLSERMRIISRLIKDEKISPEKLLELQVEYCYLQRDYAHFIEKESAH